MRRVVPDMSSGRAPVRRGLSAAPKPTATIKKVAHRAGVSIATVSRTFADPGSVSQELRVRVHEAARLLNYRASRAARALRVGTSQTVGVVIPDLQNPFFTGVVRGIDL